MQPPKLKRRKIQLVPKINPVPGNVFVVGMNECGQLGLGQRVSKRKTPAILESYTPIVDIAAGGVHSMCLTSNGHVFTFGCNDEGALGRAILEEKFSHVPGLVNIPERIVQISAGDSHSAALSETGQVYVWGNFRDGNGAMGLVTSGWKENNPVRILHGVTVVKIASGNDHLVCLSQECNVYTCGCADVGQLGRMCENVQFQLIPETLRIAETYRSAAVNIWTASYATFCKIQDSGVVYACGLNNYDQLGLPGSATLILKPQKVTSLHNKSWIKIVGDQHHTLSLDETNLVHALGRPEYGRLGLGEDNNIKSVPTIIPALQDKKCIDISCGNCVSFAVTEDGYVYSWGMGDNYQLGQGDHKDKFTPNQIGGDFSELWKALKVAAGGQHTLILATARE